VLHDLPSLASAFIHMTPVSLSWSLRWFASDVMAQYPGLFILPDAEVAATVTFWDIFAPAMAFYIVWWILYTFIYM